MNALRWFTACGIGAVAGIGILSAACGNVKDAASTGAEKAASAAADAADALKDDGTYYYPLKGKVQEVGYEPGAGDHVGRDLYAVDLDSDNRAVYPTRGGKVAFADTNCQKSGSQSSCYGNTVAVDHGDGTYALYTHLAQKPNLRVGQSVSLSMQLGTVGTSGCEGCGTHLHFVVRKGPKGLTGTGVLFGQADLPVDIRDVLKAR